MSFVEKYDIKIRDRGVVRQQIESHIEDVFETLNSQIVLADCDTWKDNICYICNVLSFLVRVEIMSKRDADKYYEKIKDLHKERIYLRM